MKFRYILIDEFANISGTGDREIAVHAFETGSDVIDAEIGHAWQEGDEGEHADGIVSAPIEEAEAPE